MATSPAPVHVELLEEGTACVRPVPTIDLGDGKYRILATDDYDPEDETWQFPPGSVVRCRTEVWSGGPILVARELVKD